MWMRRSSHHRGRHMEALAARWLTERGLVQVASNVTFKGGELDLIMRDGETLVFVEVRHRASNQHGSALESITHAKQRRLIRAASLYLQSHPAARCRFDVVAIDGADAEHIHWIKNAFDAV
ncbi:YraN family protein [Larsenimonas suaedae]|nr:YraN family protein [Larsenimonas suaedae]